MLDWTLTILGALSLLVTLYLLALAAAALLPERRRRAPQRQHSFAVVIPAHNETAVLAATLERVLALDYPRHLFDVFVIADNCSDDTAEIARSAGAVCLERRDPDRWGKGYALDWAFGLLLARGRHDAFVVIDADTLADRGFLEAANRRLCEGALAIQGYYDVQHPWTSPVESLSYIGFVATRLLRYRGRSKLGLSSNLLGNGMCFARQVIERFGWSATSILEDVEYGMQLQLAGVRVVFAEEARVFAEIPSTFAGAANQGRWDLGKLAVARRYLLPLLRAAVTRSSARCLDAAMDLLIPPFPILISLMTAGFAAFLLLGAPPVAAASWIATAAGMALYTATCLVVARARPRVYVSLLYAPFFILWRLFLMVRDIFEKKHARWVKTERELRAD